MNGQTIPYNQDTSLFKMVDALTPSFKELLNGYDLLKDLVNKYELDSHNRFSLERIREVIPSLFINMTAYDAAKLDGELTIFDMNTEIYNIMDHAEEIGVLSSTIISIIHCIKSNNKFTAEELEQYDSLFIKETPLSPTISKDIRATGYDKDTPIFMMVENLLNSLYKLVKTYNLVSKISKQPNIKSDIIGLNYPFNEIFPELAAILNYYQHIITDNEVFIVDMDNEIKDIINIMCMIGASNKIIDIALYKIKSSNDLKDYDIEYLKNSINNNTATEGDV